MSKEKEENNIEESLFLRLINRIKVFDDKTVSAGQHSISPK